MLRILVLTLALAPVVASAEQVWRWTDGAGRLHYSNEAGKVPADAEPVRTQIRVVHAVPAPEHGARFGVGHVGRTHRAGGRAVEASGGCSPSAYGYIVLNNPHELADQVKQASLLDALKVPWRNVP